MASRRRLARDGCYSGESSRLTPDPPPMRWPRPRGTRTARTSSRPRHSGLLKPAPHRRRPELRLCSPEPGQAPSGENLATESPLIYLRRPSRARAGRPTHVLADSAARWPPPTQGEARTAPPTRQVKAFKTSAATPPPRRRYPAQRPGRPLPAPPRRGSPSPPAHPRRAHTAPTDPGRRAGSPA